MPDKTLMEALLEAGYYDPQNQVFNAEPNGEWRWYGHEDDMAELSERFPDALFKLHGEGENRDDVWDKYFVGGELVEKVYAVMFMPEPKKVKWEGAKRECCCPTGY